MDDTKRYTIQIKGTAYRCLPLDLAAVERLQLMSLMDVSPELNVRTVMSLLKDSIADEKVWDELVQRFVSGEVPLTELTQIFDKLLKRTIKDAGASGDDE